MKSQYIGITWRTRTGKWVANITIDGRRCEIGSYNDEIECAKAYDRRAFLVGRKTNILKFKKVGSRDKI